jgi:hypothetical protein
VWLGNFLYIIIILNMLVITGMLELFFPNKLVHLVRKSEGGGHRNDLAETGSNRKKLEIVELFNMPWRLGIVSACQRGNSSYGS